ncbi:MAG: aspartate/glutamate racemase family protein [Pirellulales bacterium]
MRVLNCLAPKFSVMAIAAVVVCCLQASTAWAQAAQAESPALLPSLKTLVDQASSANKQQAFTFDRTVFSADTRDLPIGVFDSGIGGLTVLEAILSLDQFNNDTLQPTPDGKSDFEGEKFIYFGDQANMPYGNYAAAGKEDYLRELILKDAIFLLGKRFWSSGAVSPSSAGASSVNAASASTHSKNSCQLKFDKPPVKAIVIACNTATAYGLEDIKAALKSWNIPVFVVGVVEAGARGVLELRNQSDKNQADTNQSSIAVLATLGTCSSGAYPRMIQATLGRAGKKVPTIVQQGFVELAAAIEGDSTVAGQGSIDDYLARDLRKMLDDYRKSGGTQPIGTIILGCTHYPLVQSEILGTLSRLKNSDVDGSKPYQKLIADKIDLVNPAALTAKELFRELARNQLRATVKPSLGNETNSPKISASFFMSIPNASYSGVKLNQEGNLEQQYKYSRSAGQLSVEDTINVPMQDRLLPPSSLTLMKTRLPHVWNCFQASQR